MQIWYTFFHLSFFCHVVVVFLPTFTCFVFVVLCRVMCVCVRFFFLSPFHTTWTVRKLSNPGFKKIKTRHLGSETLCSSLFLLGLLFLPFSITLSTRSQKSSCSNNLLPPPPILYISFLIYVVDFLDISCIFLFASTCSGDIFLGHVWCVACIGA